MTQSILATVKKDEIYFEPGFNMRGNVNEVTVAELAADIAAKGLLQPIVLERVIEDDLLEQGFKYRIIGGFRRSCACFNVLGWDEINASIMEPMTKMERAIVNLSENIQRQDFTYLEETMGIKYLFDMGFGELEVMRMLNVSRGWIQPRAMFLKLPAYVQRNAFKIPQGWAEYGRDLYNIFHNQGESECIRIFDYLVISKQNNPDAAISLKQFIKPSKMSKPKPPKEKLKTKQEMINMNSRILQVLEEDSDFLIVPRAIAWCIGSVPTEDFEAELEALGIELPEVQE